MKNLEPDMTIITTSSQPNVKKLINVIPSLKDIISLSKLNEDNNEHHDLVN